MTETLDVSPVAPGDVLAGKYRVERVLGIGGMGVVVAAMHLQLQQTVALKFALPSALQSPAAVERFLREARAAVRLKSEHVAKVLDVGTLETGAPYMVMEYLDGSDLGGVVTKLGPLPIESAADYVLQACEALAEAHSLGIIHRDLKPQNLFLTQSVGGAALVKVLDFGISKMTMGIDSSLTQTSTVMGSPLYMSPEQMRSARNADARSDIWALGVILFELLTGDVPFNAETMPELCLKVVTDLPRAVSDFRGDVPRGLTDAITKCLEKDPKARFQNAAELAAALEPFAPASSKNAATRARMVLSTEQVRGSFPSLSQLPPTPISQATTQGAVTGDTKAAPAPKSKTPLYIALAGFVILVSGAAIVMSIVSRPTAPAAAGSSPLSSTRTATMVAPPPGPSVATAATAPPVASLPATTTASARSASAVTAPPVLRGYPVGTTAPVVTTAAPTVQTATAAPTATDDGLPRTRH